MKKMLRVLPLLLVYIAIIYFSLKRPSGTPPRFENIDKFYHFIAYFTLGFTISFSMSNKIKKFIFLIISLIMGPSLEFIQGTLPYRDMSLADGITNVLGLLVGILIFHILIKQIYSIFKILRLDKIYFENYNC